MKIIDFDTIKNMNISPVDCYHWVSEMIVHKRDALLPPKAHMTLSGNVICNVMPCIVPNGADGNVGGLKIGTRYPSRVPALDSKILLMDMNSGETLAMLDGVWITAMRTGAVAAHSVKHFAKSDWQVVGLIGLGNTARASLEVLSAVCDRPIHVKLLRYKDQAEQFMDRFAGYPNLTIEIVETTEQCIRDSDVIISCATYFANDIAQDAWFKEGVLVVPVHTRGFMNCDLFFDKVFADDTGHVCDFKYFDRFKYFAEVCDAVTGREEGRTNDRERILAYNIGIAIHDIYYAMQIYNNTINNEKLLDGIQEIDFHGPKEKFWC